MPNNELIAALEALCTAAPARHFDDEIALVRAHIDTLRNGGGRAQIVAWLQDDEATAQIAAFVASQDPESVQRGIKLAAHLASMPDFDFKAADRRALAFGEHDASGAHLAGDGGE